MAERIFQDRVDAGRQLANLLVQTQIVHPFVLGLAKGGVPIADVVAKQLNAPLDVVITKRLLHPNKLNEAIGATAEDLENTLEDCYILPSFSWRDLGAGRIHDKLLSARAYIHEQRQLFRQGRSLPNLNNCTAIVIDDGWATGATMIAAIRAVLHHNPLAIIAATPVGFAETTQEILHEGSNISVVTVHTTSGTGYIRDSYHDFHNVSTQEVLQILSRHRRTYE